MTSPSELQPAAAAELRTHLADKVLPRLLADGVLGQDVTIASQDISPVGGYGKDHWLSCTFKVALELRNDKLATTRKEHFVAKFQGADSVWSDSAVLARNEEIMYSQVVPFFESLWAESGALPDSTPLDLFPKCYLATGGARPLVFMEDLTAKGYRLSPSACALDGAHVFLALQHLGKLHALSYTAKLRRKSDFLSVARELGDAEFNESRRSYQAGFLSQTLSRGLRRLAERSGGGAGGGAGGGDLPAATVEHLRRRLRSDRDSSEAFDNMVDAKTAEEPLAVVVHGDFCRNNIMFKYDPDTGRPVDVRFFDLQTSKYCSPAVDLSFFLFLNTTPSQRAAHWDDFFVAYYDGLTSAMRRMLSSGPDMSPTMEMPSLASLRAEFARHALYGCSICSFFLPVMQGKAEEAPNEETCNRLGALPDRFESGVQMGKLFHTIGGEAGDDVVADLLLEFVDRGLVGL